MKKIWILILILLLIPVTIKADVVINPDTKICEDYINFHMGIILFDEYWDQTYSNNLNDFTDKFIKDDLMGRYFKLRVLEEPTPNPWWMNLYGQNIIICNSDTNTSTRIGDVFVARTIEGIACGRFVVHTDSMMGFMAIYRDDPYSKYRKEGPKAGEQYYLYHNDMRCGNVLMWTSFGDMVKIDTLYLD